MQTVPSFLIGVTLRRMLAQAPSVYQGPETGLPDRPSQDLYYPLQWAKNSEETPTRASQNISHILVRDELEHGCPRNTDYRTSKTDCPLGAAQSNDAKCRAAHEDDEYLTAHHQKIYHDEPPIFPNTLKDIEFVV